MAAGEAGAGKAGEGSADGEPRNESMAPKMAYCTAGHSTIKRTKRWHASAINAKRVIFAAFPGLQISAKCVLDFVRIFL